VASWLGHRLRGSSSLPPCGSTQRLRDNKVKGCTPSTPGSIKPSHSPAEVQISWANITNTRESAFAFQKKRTNPRQQSPTDSKMGDSDTKGKGKGKGKEKEKVGDKSSSSGKQSGGQKGTGGGKKDYGGSSGRTTDTKSYPCMCICRCSGTTRTAHSSCSSCKAGRHTQ
jgi:hypothetical protein